MVRLIALYYCCCFQYVPIIPGPGISDTEAHFNAEKYNPMYVPTKLNAKKVVK